MLQQIHFRAFASVKKTDGDAPPDKKPRTRATKKTTEPVPVAIEAVEVVKPKRVRKSKTEAKESSENTQLMRKMYVLKFNSPILPYAKFPLTQNKYI
jgi:hypothetical protein